MNILKLLLVLAFFGVLSTPSHAQEVAAPADPISNAMTDGEIRKVDKDSKKITIKHEEIKNLDMPRMTMVFQVKDVAMLEKVKVGDMVKFSVEKSAGAMVITEIVPKQ